MVAIKTRLSDLLMWVAYFLTAPAVGPLLMKQNMGGDIFSSAGKELIALKHPEIGLR